MRLRGKTAIITGAGSGMGRAAALQFLREGAHVAIVDINETAIAAVVAEGEAIAPGCILGLRADASNEADCAAAVCHAAKFLGPVNVLYNNLGVNLSATVTETAPEQWARIFRINVRSMYFMCRQVLPMMMQQKGGIIINTSSSGGAIALKGLAAYSASKGAVIGLTRSIAADYAKYNIRANYLIPGVIMTQMTKNVIAAQPDPEAYSENMRTNNPLHRFGEEQEIAMTAVYLASDETTFMTGASMVVDGGYMAQ